MRVAETAAERQSPPAPVATNANRWAVALTLTTKPHVDFPKSRFDFCNA
jgi:hypothetical protein